MLGWNVDGFGVELGESPSQVKAVEAAREIAKLARGLRQLSVFKVSLNSSYFVRIFWIGHAILLC